MPDTEPGSLLFSLLLLGGLMLDGGCFGQCVILSMAAAWWSMLLVMAFARRTPTLGDHIAIRYGFPMILVLIVVGRWMQGNTLSQVFPR